MKLKTKIIAILLPALLIAASGIAWHIEKSAHEEEIPAITRTGSSEDREAKIFPYDYGILDEADLPAPTEYEYRLTFDDRTGFLAPHHSPSLSLIWKDDGKVSASGRRYFIGDEGEWSKIYRYSRTHYDERGRKISSLSYETRNSEKKLRLRREEKTFYSEDGKSSRTQTTMYFPDRNEGICKARTLGEIHDEKVSHYDDGTVRDYEYGDLRYTNDSKGNYLTYWHFEGGAWRFKNKYDSHGRLVRQTATREDGEVRTFKWKYDRNGKLLEETRPVWLWTGASRTTYRYAKSGELLYTARMGGEGLLGDLDPEATPFEHCITVTLKRKTPLTDINQVTYATVGDYAGK